MRIFLDGGTTNTRLSLWDDCGELHRIKLSIGAKDTVLQASGAPLRQAVRDGIRQLLSQAQKTEEQVEYIAASGMIGSELGLYTVAHIPTPAGKKELREGSVRVTLEDISPLPFWFIPGVLDGGSQPDPLLTDVMRGEEAEAMGILSLEQLRGPLILLLPGSHNKILFIDGENRISRFYTTLSGELTQACAQHTILLDGLAGGFTKEPEPEALLSGCYFARDNGVTAALFKVRILQKFSQTTPLQRYSFLLGAVLSQDLQLLEKSAGDRLPIVAAGSNPFKKALALLVPRFLPNPLLEVPDAHLEQASAVGVLSILQS